jgi:hypothetical protein
VSVVFVVGLALALGPRMTVGGRFAVAWAILPTFALSFYWHHDLLLGPRMLSDTAPAWCIAVAAAIWSLGGGVTAPDVKPPANRWQSLVWLATATSAIATIVVVGPRAMRDIRQRFAAPAPTSAPPSPALVFVHDAWTARITSKLAAAGMRADSVAAAIGQNDTCTLNRFANALVDGDPAGAGLRDQIRFRPGESDGSERRILPSGVPVRLHPDREFTPDCLDEALADRGGVQPLMTYVWRGWLPGLGGSSTRYVRDLGPERNARVLSMYPGLPAVLLMERSRGILSFVPYESAMSALWGGGGGGGGGGNDDDGTRQ